MAKYSISDATLAAIGDAVRAQEGTTDAIPVTELAERIGAIQGGGGTTYDITLNVDSSGFDLYYSGYCYSGLSSGDNPGSIQVTGAQCIVVVVYSSGAWCSGGGCVESELLSMYNSDLNGTLFIMPVSGESTTGELTITDY